MDAAEKSRRAEYALEKALRDAESNGQLATAGNPTGANQYKSGIGAQCTNSTKKPSRSTFVPDKHEAADLRKMGDATEAQFEQANHAAREEDNPQNSMSEFFQKPLGTPFTGRTRGAAAPLWMGGDTLPAPYAVVFISPSMCKGARADAKEVEENRPHAPVAVAVIDRASGVGRD